MKTFARITKTKRLLLRNLTLVLVLFCTVESQADYLSTTRKKCTTLFPKYVLTGWMVHHYYDNLGNETGKSISFARDHGCGYAAIYLQSPLNPFTNTPYSVLDIRIGSFPHYIHWTTSREYTVGSSFTPPGNSPPEDTAGIARAELASESSIVGVTSNSSVVTINNFTGFISAKSNSWYGALYRVMIWRNGGPIDSVVTPVNALSEGIVRIEHGQIFTGGLFNPGDFVVTSDIDPVTGDSIIKVIPTPGLQKSITVAGDTTDNSIAVTISSCAGYGIYDPNQVYLNATNPAQQIPTISEWGLIILTVLLTGLGIYFINKRKLSLK